MSAHTPGPWRYYTEPQPNGCPIVGNGRGLMVCMCAHSVHQNDQRDEALANARLIAAAPDLMEAVRISEQLASIATDWNLDEVEIDGEMVSTYELRERFKAALKKAEGKS